EGEMEPQEVEVGVATALKANAFTRDGFKFQGWATTVNGEVEYANKAEVTLTDSNLELFAVWKQNTIAVIYSPNGGTGLMNPHKLTVNETFNLDKVAYTYTDKTFIGWSTTADGEVEYEDEAEFTIGTKSVVLYAIWKDGAEEPEEPPVDPDPNPKAILFSTGGGNGLMTPIKGLSTGQVVKLPACAYTKDGYTFAGWATTSGGAVVYQDCADFTVGTSNAVLYAVWVA
ncbi:MAG: InlB B-repeat-containing protein, partial [Clostridia bacterium]|nr:InlB B-repeat-containing protein [Clostridia bacterium]